MYVYMEDLTACTLNVSSLLLRPSSLHYKMGGVERDTLCVCVFLCVGVEP